MRAFCTPKKNPPSHLSQQPPTPAYITPMTSLNPIPPSTLPFPGAQPQTTMRAPHTATPVSTVAVAAAATPVHPPPRHRSHHCSQCRPRAPCPTIPSKMSTSESNSTASSSSTEGGDWPVTEEWLQAVLKEHHSDLAASASSITVLDFTVRPGCDAGESVLSDILAVAVKYRLKSDPDAVTHSLSFIIKLLPQDPFSRFFVTEAQFDLREIKFYTQVVPDLENFVTQHQTAGDRIHLPIPKCYYAHYSAGSTEPDQPTPPESVLVLENIKPAGFTGADFSRGLTLAQATAAIEAIAKVHGMSLALKIKEGKPLAERYPFLFQTTRASDSYQQLVERGLPQLAGFLEKRQGLEGILEALNVIRPKTKDIIERLLAPEEPMALITHTDFWCNNLMFREEESGSCVCSILDWQMVTYSRPTNDLALLIVSSLPAELRRLHTDALLDNYWQSITTTCIRLGLDVEKELGYSRRKLSEDYKFSQLLSLLLCIGSVDVALGNPLTEERLLELLRDLYADGLLQPDAVVITHKE